MDDGAWALPGGARDLLKGRLRPVSETGWQLLTAAAVLGRSFDFDTVREASGRSEEEAAEYFRLAGDHGRSLYANADALAHYEAALALGHPRAGVLHEAMGDLRTLLGEYVAALTHYEAAAALADGAALAGLEHKLGNVHARRGDADLAESHYEAALGAFDPLLDESGRGGEQARLYADWSLLEHRRAETGRAGELAERALDLAEDAGDARHRPGPQHARHPRRRGRGSGVGPPPPREKPRAGG